jgi:hypothetical protein
MSFEAMLAARAHDLGKAQPTALFRHRALAEDPLSIVAWQLGAEPYSVGAIAMGTKTSGYTLYVPGYPIDRDLLFDALTLFARQFCPAFEAYAAGPCEIVSRYGIDLMVPKTLPQIVVANVETVALLGRLGRRLAYLSTTGEHAADPVLPRLGRHLMWLADYAHLPGQQLILSVTDLLTTHYTTAMSPYEVGSLAAIDAWIAPPRGKHGFHAAEAAERQAVGPTPDPEDGERVYQLMSAFNAARRRRKNPAFIRKLIKPLQALYQNMVDDTWSLIWKTVERERGRPEATSVARRAREDRIAYASHLNWMAGLAEGRRRTRLDPRQAAMRLNEYERAHARLLAEEAIDDPLRMAPVLLAGQAIAGEVVRAQLDRRELINNRFCRRPSITLRTDEPCMMPLGTELWWTKTPAGREWLLTQVAAAGSGSDVTLILQTNRVPGAGLPRCGDRICFSELNTREAYEVHLPQATPWTHRPKGPPSAETDLDSSEAA